MADLEKRTADILVIANISEVNLGKMINAYCGAIVVRPCNNQLYGMNCHKSIVQGITAQYTITWEMGAEQQVEFMPNRVSTVGKLNIGSDTYEIAAESDRRIVSAKLSVEYDDIRQLDDTIKKQARAWIKKNAVPYKYPQSRLPGRLFLTGNE